MSSAFFDAVMHRERTALITEQRLTGMPAYSAVGDIGIVRDLPTSLRRQHPVNLEALGETSFVQACPTLGYRFLWVHVENDRYRRDYELHLKRCYGDAAQPLPADLHVDHLYNRERARVFKLTYIRMVLLPRGINTSHGAGYERLRTRGVGRAPPLDRHGDAHEAVRLPLAAVERARHAGDRPLRRAAGGPAGRGTGHLAAGGGELAGRRQVPAGLKAVPNRASGSSAPPG